MCRNTGITKKKNLELNNKWSLQKKILAFETSHKQALGGRPPGDIVEVQHGPPRGGQQDELERQRGLRLDHRPAL